MHYLDPSDTQVHGTWRSGVTAVLYWNNMSNKYEKSPKS